MCSAVTVVGDGDREQDETERERERGRPCVGGGVGCAKGMAIPRAALPCIERAHVSLMQPDKYLSIT